MVSNITLTEFSKNRKQEKFRLGEAINVPDKY
jgi:hypothetical protein